VGERLAHGDRGERSIGIVEGIEDRRQDVGRKEGPGRVVYDDLLGRDALEAVRNGGLTRVATGDGVDATCLEIGNCTLGANDDDGVAQLEEDVVRPLPQGAAPEGPELLGASVARITCPAPAAAGGQDRRDATQGMA
jgi:hypothetical protein